MSHQQAWMDYHLDEPKPDWIPQEEWDAQATRYNGYLEYFRMYRAEHPDAPISERYHDMKEKTAHLPEEPEHWDDTQRKDDITDRCPILSTRTFYNHYGKNGEELATEGTIVLHDLTTWQDEDGNQTQGTFYSPLGGYYLEASGCGKLTTGPFFSILSGEDQWGTWHTIKLGDADPVTFPQAWAGQEKSFLRQLGEALIELAEKSEH